MKYVDVMQGSSEWLQARCGIPTASEFHRILTPGTLKVSRQMDTYMYRLLAEWMTGTPFADEVRIWSTSMEDGLAREQESVEYFELVSGETTSLAGFCLTDDGKVGASPDRFIGDKEGLFEAKNPIASTHVGWLLEEGVPREHLLQVQGQLFVTGLKRHVFLSYYPGLPPLLVESAPILEIQAALALALRVFNLRMGEAKERLAELKERTS